jgi:hypothetical protein
LPKKHLRKRYYICSLKLKGIKDESNIQDFVLSEQEHNEPSIGILSLGLFDTTNPVYDTAEEEFRRRMKKKKKRGPRL